MSKQLMGPTGIPIPKIKAESETQTSTQPRPLGRNQSLVQSNTNPDNESKSSQEQGHAGSSIRRRRNISKNRQGVKQREKTPEPSKVSLPHEDTTTTDEDDVRNSREIEADDIYEEMKRMVEKKSGEKDEDDIDIDELREQRTRAEQDRRRRSISPYSKPSPEELERLQRRSSFIDPDNKLLGAVPIYTLGPKGKDENLSRKDSLILDKKSDRSNSLSVPSSPSTPGSPLGENKFPFPLSGSPKKDCLSDARANVFIRDSSSPSPSPITVRKNNKNTSSIVKTSNVKQQLKADIKPRIQSPQNVGGEDLNLSKDVPVKPARSKSGTRSDGKTSESEISGDNRTTQTNAQTKTPKPKERRKTIAAIKRNAREISNQKRSQSATRAKVDSLQPKLEISKTSSDIIDLLQKASRRSLSIPNEDLRTSASEFRVDEKKRLITPCRTPETPKSRNVRTPKRIQLIKPTDILQTLTTAQRQELEMENSRRSSGYIEASQSEYTSSCYSSSYDSEDDYDFDLSKKTAELNRKLNELSLENEELRSVVRKRNVIESRSDDKEEKKKKVAKAKINDPPKTKIGRFFQILLHIWEHWNDFKLDNRQEYVKIHLLFNRCICDLWILLIFCGLGGFMFRYTEGSFENLYKCNSKRVKRDFIDALWQGVHRLNEDDWKSMARRKLWEFENELHTAHEAGVRSNSGLNSWNFMNSVVYCLTVVTTIGYGHIAPSTTPGRIATIVYAIIGIPMFLILLADFGKLFTRCMKFFWAFVRRLYYTGSCKKVRRTVPVKEVMKGFNMVVDAVRRPSQIVYDTETGLSPPELPPKPETQSANRLSIPNITRNDDSSSISEPQTPAPSVFEIDDEFNLPISVAVTILLTYIFIGAIIYNIWERWGFFEAFYFVFISMSTIGFGDYVPNHPMYMMASIVYLVFGLALTSMCINVVQVKLSDSFRQASAKIGATIGLKVLEEDGSLVPVTPPTVEMPGVHGSTKTSDKDEEDKTDETDKMNSNSKKDT